MLSRLVRQLALFILSVATSIVVGWLLMDQVERKRREELARQEEIPLPYGGLEDRNGNHAQARPANSATGSNSGASTAKPAAKPTIVPKSDTSTTRTSTKSDDLTIIEGIGPAYAKALNAIDVRTFADLANADAADLASRMATRVTADRIRQDDWIGQARQLSS